VSTVQITAPWLDAFRKGMADLQWVEGRDYVIDARNTNGVEQAGPALAAELVATQPDLLLVHGDESARQLAQITKRPQSYLPMLKIPSATSLQRACDVLAVTRRVLTSLARDLAAIRLQLLKEAVPRVAHIVLLFDSTYVGSASQVKVIDEAAARLRMRVTSIGLRQAADVESAFNAARHWAPRLHFGSRPCPPRTPSDRRSLHDLQGPVISEISTFAEAGGLMSYGPSWKDNFAARPATWTRSSRARNRATCRSSSRLSLSWCSYENRQGDRYQVPAIHPAARRPGD